MHVCNKHASVRLPQCCEAGSTGAASNLTCLFPAESLNFFRAHTHVPVPAGRAVKGSNLVQLCCIHWRRRAGTLTSWLASDCPGAGPAQGCSLQRDRALRGSLQQLSGVACEVGMQMHAEQRGRRVATPVHAMQPVPARHLARGPPLRPAALHLAAWRSAAGSADMDAPGPCSTTAANRPAGPHRSSSQRWPLPGALLARPRLHAPLIYVVRGQLVQAAPRAKVLAQHRLAEQAGGDAEGGGARPRGLRRPGSASPAQQEAAENQEQSGAKLLPAAEGMHALPAGRPISTSVRATDVVLPLRPNTWVQVQELRSQMRGAVVCSGTGRLGASATACATSGHAPISTTQGRKARS